MNTDVFSNLQLPIILREKKNICTKIKAYLTDIEGLVLEHCNKVNIAIKQATNILVSHCI